MACTFEHDVTSTYGSRVWVYSRMGTTTVSTETSMFHRIVDDITRAIEREVVRDIVGKSRKNRRWYHAHRPRAVDPGEIPAVELSPVLAPMTLMRSRTELAREKRRAYVQGLAS